MVKYSQSALGSAPIKIDDLPEGCSSDWHVVQLYRDARADPGMRAEGWPSGARDSDHITSAKGHQARCTISLPFLPPHEPWRATNPAGLD